MTDLNNFNARLIAEFRENAGKVGGPFADAPLLLLTTTGAKSGQKRTAPVVYGRDGERIFVIASMGGAPRNPAWYHNLVANPLVTVELGTETFEARATVTAGEERDRLYRKQAQVMPGFDEYQKRTTRQIPVILLERSSG